MSALEMGVAVFGIGLALFPAGVFWKYKRLPYISIRWKFLGIFLYVAFIQILLLIVVGNRYLGEMQAHILADAKLEAVKFLQAADRNNPLGSSSFKLVGKQYPFAGDGGDAEKIPEEIRQRLFSGEPGSSLQCDTFLLDGRHFIVVAMPESDLQNRRLIASKALDEEMRKLESIRSGLICIGLATLLFTVAVFFPAANRLLKPVKELSRGLAAIKTQRFDYRIPETDPDELGDLAAIFNTIVEDHHQMAMGKLVQRELFPRDSLSVGEYRIFGLSRPATDLGGDYLDYMPVGEGKFMVVIGDVTGHGVPAALVMAMAKAIFHHLSRTNAFPLQMLENLNQVLYETVRRTRLLSLGVLWVDTRTDEATFFNCGHLNPALRREEGNLSFLQSSGVVLGRLPRVKTAPVSFLLMPGERLIFYTDGLIESFIHQGSQAPHDDFKEYLRSRPHLSIEEACANILNELPTALAGETQPDDFSIVIVERLP